MKSRKVSQITKELLLNVFCHTENMKVAKRVIKQILIKHENNSNSTKATI